MSLQVQPVSCDTDVLSEVLLCPPWNYPAERFDVARWKGLFSSVSKPSVDTFVREHTELVEALRTGGVGCVVLDPHDELPFQVFTRDACTLGPSGPVLSRMSTLERRGEPREVERLCAQFGRHVTRLDSSDGRARWEGGDLHLIREGAAVIGYNDRRTTSEGAALLADHYRSLGWRVHIQQYSSNYHHLDATFAMAAPSLAVADLSWRETDLDRFLKSLRIEVIFGSYRTLLGANVLALGDEAVVSALHADGLNRALRSYGLTVYDPDVVHFAVDGGSVRCMTQPWTRL